jgi:hypothetical protein
MITLTVIALTMIILTMIKFISHFLIPPNRKGEVSRQPVGRCTQRCLQKLQDTLSSTSHKLKEKHNLSY